MLKALRPNSSLNVGYDLTFFKLGWAINIDIQACYRCGELVFEMALLLFCTRVGACVVCYLVVL